MKDISFKDFDILSPSEKEEAITLLSRYEQIDKQDNCRKDFLSFVKYMWGDAFIEGRHHKIIANKFNKIKLPHKLDMPNNKHFNEIEILLNKSL